MLCRHCQQRQVVRPRGLCFNCYYAPGVRDLYPSTSKFARRGYGGNVNSDAKPITPTQAVPGSPEKIAAMQERAKMNVSVFHVHDEPMDRESRKLGYR